MHIRLALAFDSLIKIDLMKSADDTAMPLLSYFEESSEEILQFIRWLVEQESMSRDAEATSRIAENLADRLAKDGATVDFLADPHYGASLRARSFAMPSS